MFGNLKQLLEDLARIEGQVDGLSHLAREILQGNHEALKGLLVEIWNGKRYRILNCTEHRGVITCYGTVAKVERRSGRNSGKPGTRAYHIGRLSELKIVEDKDGQA